MEAQEIYRLTPKGLLTVKGSFNEGKSLEQRMKDAEDILTTINDFCQRNDLIGLARTTDGTMCFLKTDGTIF